jgi:hypothetical protein
MSLVVTRTKKMARGLQKVYYNNLLQIFPQDLAPFTILTTLADSPAR